MSLLYQNHSFNTTHNAASSRDNFDEILQRRGIAEVANRYGWRAQSNGWEYPVIDPITGTKVRRWKAANSDAKMKYRWPDGKPNGVNYYAPVTDLSEIITRSSGELIIVNGEPAVLTLHAAGYPNTLSWFGENSVPKSLINDLGKLGVTRVIYLADADMAGTQSAVKVRDILRGSGIDFEAYSWGSNAKTGYDANDAWIDAQFNNKRFTKILANLNQLALPEPIEKSGKIDTTIHYELNIDQLTAVNSALENLAGHRLNYNAEGWTTKAMSSPHREDAHPSFSYNRFSGVGKDHATGETYSLNENTIALGLDPGRFRQASSAEQGRRVDLNAMPDDEPLPDQLDAAPRSFLVKLNEYCAPSVRYFVYWLYRARSDGHLPPQFTAGQAKTAIEASGGQVSSSIYRVFKDLEKSGLSIALSFSHVYKDYTCDFDNEGEFYSLRPYSEAIGELQERAKFREYERAHPVIRHEKYLANDRIGDDLPDNILAEITPAMVESTGVQGDIVAIANQANDAIKDGHKAQNNIEKKQTNKARWRLKQLAVRLRDITPPVIDAAFPVNSPKDLTVVLAREYLLMNVGHPVSYRELATALGISASGDIKQIIRAAGFEPSTSNNHVLVSITTIGQIDIVAKQARGKPISVVITNGDHKREYPLTGDEYQSLAARIETAQDIGAEVQVKLACAYEYECVSDVPPQTNSDKNESSFEPEIEPTPRRPKPPAIPNLPKEKRAYTTGYSPRWVFVQLAYAISLTTNWEIYPGTGNLIDFKTGEIILRTPDAGQLLNLIISNYRPDDSGTDSLIAEAIAMGGQLICEPGDRAVNQKNCQNPSNSL